MTAGPAASAQWMDERPPVELAPEEVHLWRASTALERPDIARLWGALELGEERRALRLPKGAARDAFVVTRAALRVVLAGYAGVAASDVAFRYSAYGKPYLATPGAKRQLDFSVTHSGAICIIAVAASREIGVDAERVRPRLRAEKVAARLFCGGTAQLLIGLDDHARAGAFSAAWTQREAYAKAVGVGVFRSYDALPFEWPRRDHVQLHEEHRPGALTRVWSVLAFAPEVGYAATLVAEGAIDGVRCFDAAGLLAP